VCGDIMAFKISQKNDECIGCGACVAIAPEDWKMNGDKAILIDGKKTGDLLVKTLPSVRNNKQAESACPVQCIKVEETK
jgi:ferredoxin